MQEPIVVEAGTVRPARRSYTKEFKIDLVAQCKRGDRSVAQVAMDNQINSNLLRRWQREFDGELASNKLLPVNVATSGTSSVSTGYIEINIHTNTLKVVGAVDGHYVAQLVHSLR